MFQPLSNLKRSISQSTLCRNRIMIMLPAYAAVSSLNLPNYRYGPKGINIDT